MLLMQSKIAIFNRLARIRIVEWGWVDGPMSCSCNDPEELCGDMCKHVLQFVLDAATGIVVAVTVLVCSQTPVFN